MSATAVVTARPSAQSAAPERRRTRGPRAGSPRVLRALRVASPLAVVALWQLASSLGVLDPSTLASPAQLARTAWELTRSGELPHAVAVSARRAALGFALGAAVAIAAGTVVGLSRVGDAVLDPLMQMLRMLPLFGLVPLFIIWFGIQEEPKIYLVALAVVVPLYLNLVAALRGVDRDLVEVARVLRLRRAEAVRHVYLPAVLPGVLVGLRQALGLAWITLIVAEQVNAGAGLGFLVNNARDFLLTDVIVVGLLCYAALGLVTDGVVRALEWRALRWRDGGETA
ncbi:MAG: ABC transporter permease [Nocardioides sp.]|nr:ABC transporter permease [Nocardioides sp.]